MLREFRRIKRNQSCGTVGSNGDRILKPALPLIGPSFNVYVTRKKINGEYGTINIPYTVYEHEYADKKLFMWIGLNVGVSLKL